MTANEISRDSHLHPPNSTNEKRVPPVDPRHFFLTKIVHARCCSSLFQKSWSFAARIAKSHAASNIITIQHRLQCNAVSFDHPHAYRAPPTLHLCNFDSLWKKAHPRPIPHLPTTSHSPQGRSESLHTHTHTHTYTEREGCTHKAAR